MPIITVSGVPHDIDQDKLNKLCFGIRATVVNMRVLGLTTNEVTVFFPADLLSEGLGEEVIARVDGLFLNQRRTKIIKQQLAEAIRDCIKEYFPDALVECFIHSFDPEEGFATSEPIE